jgi:hypothetical protein
MDRLPQSNAYNPAIIPELKFHIGLPLLNGVKAQVYNDGFTYGELDDFLDNLGSEGYNPEEFIRSIGEYNNFRGELSANILSIGFKLKEKGYFALNINANSLTLNKAQADVVYLLADYDNIPADIFPLQVDEMELIENTGLNIGVTYSRKISDNLTVGVKPNINFNTVGIRTSDIKYVVERVQFNEPYEEYDGSTAYYEYVDYYRTFLGKVDLGLPEEINPDATNGNEIDLDEGLFSDDFPENLKIGDLFQNGTFSLDLGVTYQLNKWTFSASALNLGSSKWKNYSYELEGDSNSEMVYYEEKDEIKIGIPTKIYLGATNQFSPKWNYGLLFHNSFYETGSSTSATVSLNGYVGSMLSTSLSYTAGSQFNNLGLGLRLRIFPGTDLYVVTDNVIQIIDYKNAHGASAAFGINLSFGAKAKTSLDIGNDEILE